MSALHHKAFVSCSPCGICRCCSRCCLPERSAKPPRLAPVLALLDVRLRYLSDKPVQESGIYHKLRESLGTKHGYALVLRASLAGMEHEEHAIVRAVLV